MYNDCDIQIDKTYSAENIVSAQVESVQNTAEAFRQIDDFMNHLTEQMNVLTEDVDPGGNQDVTENGGNRILF